jgi:hypothetical protein
VLPFRRASFDNMLIAAKTPEGQFIYAVYSASSAAAPASFARHCAVPTTNVIQTRRASVGARSPRRSHLSMVQSSAWS